MLFYLFTHFVFGFEVPYRGSVHTQIYTDFGRPEGVLKLDYVKYK